MSSRVQSSKSKPSTNRIARNLFIFVAMSRAGVARADDSLVVDTTKVCIEQLKELSLKLQQNKEGLSKEDLEGYRLEIAKLLKEVIDTQFADVKTVEAIDSVLGQRQNGRDPEETKAVIKQKINEATAAYDATKDVDFVQITSILKGLSDELDEDFVMIDRGLTDADIKCPFTAQQFQEPMKKYVVPIVCIHAKMQFTFVGMIC